MTQIIRSDERYHLEADWLSTYWHFSFDHYYDPENVSFGPLRVFNDDVIQPSGGFPMHSHREMEIITYVLEGRLEHRDSLGNRGVIGAGEVQRMSAGTGIRHSEYNASETERVHLLQLWIQPAVKGLAPSWEQKKFTRGEREGKLLAVASGTPADLSRAQSREALAKAGALKIHQDATIFVSALKAGQEVTHELAPGRRAYLFVIEGKVMLNGRPAAAGDQARITGETPLTLAATEASELLLIDLP
jgi:hypothetical protein